MPETKSCFVVMGFGIKTDFATGRKLDLNKTYRLLIKPVVEEKGLTCLRADEILNTGAIDVPMYMELLKADVVIADLSTANPNALYELGVRHALRPRTTIVISEDKMPYPFDLNHIKITSYTHLGDAIDFDEVVRFRKVLGETLDAVLKDDEVDSPVYTFLKLVPPSLEEQIRQVAANQEQPAAAENDENKQTLSVLTEQGEDAIERNDFKSAKMLFKAALLIGKPEMGNSKTGANSYLTHRLAFATYKAADPDEVTGLNQALDLLGELDLAHTNDPETVGMAGAIEKRLYEKGQGESHLSAGIQYYQRGYYLLNNRYNGINLAFMLDYRAQSALCSDKDERTADLVYAKRIRREVLVMCDKDWARISGRQNKATMKDGLLRNDDLSLNQQAADNRELFWIMANRAEANFGLGNMEAYTKALEQANSMEHEPWMMASLQDQIDKLHKLINLKTK